MGTVAVTQSTAQQDIELDLTELVNSVWQTGASFVGMNLRASSEAERQRTVGDLLGCTSFGQGSAVFTEPRLEITYRVPSPNASSQFEACA